MNTKLISKLYTDLFFIRGLEKQSREINLDLQKELKRRNPKKVLVVGPYVSPCFYQLTNQIKDCLFVALDIDKNYLDLTRSVIDIVEPSEAIEKTAKNCDFSSMEKSNVMTVNKSELISFMKSRVEYAKHIMTNAIYCPVEDPKNFTSRVDFVHGDVSYLPLHGMDAILMFNVTECLDSGQLYRSFKCIDKALTENGFFAVSGPIGRLKISFWRMFKKDKYHLISFKDFKNNIYNKLSLKEIIPESLRWKVTQSKRYYCIYGEKI